MKMRPRRGNTAWHILPQCSVEIICFFYCIFFWMYDVCYLNFCLKNVKIWVLYTLSQQQFLAGTKKLWFWRNFSIYNFWITFFWINTGSSHIDLGKIIHDCLLFEHIFFVKRNVWRDSCHPRQPSVSAGFISELSIMTSKAQNLSKVFNSFFVPKNKTKN